MSVTYLNNCIRCTVIAKYTIHKLIFRQPTSQFFQSFQFSQSKLTWKNGLVKLQLCQKPQLDLGSTLVLIPRPQLSLKNFTLLLLLLILYINVLVPQIMFRIGLHSVPSVFYPAGQKFTNQLAAAGMYRNYSLNTGMDQSGF